MQKTVIRHEWFESNKALGSFAGSNPPPCFVPYASVGQKQKKTGFPARRKAPAAHWPSSSAALSAASAHARAPRPRRPTLPAEPHAVRTLCVRCAYVVRTLCARCALMVDDGLPLEKFCICTRHTIYDLHSILYKDESSLFKKCDCRPLIVERRLAHGFKTFLCRKPRRRNVLIHGA